MADHSLPTRVTPLPGGGLAIWSKEQRAALPKVCDECKGTLVKDETYFRVQLATLRPGESRRSRDDLRGIAYSRRATLSLHPACTPKEYQP